jgi:hypothetical protein
MARVARFVRYRSREISGLASFELTSSRKKCSTPTAINNSPFWQIKLFVREGEERRIPASVDVVKPQGNRDGSNTVFPLDGVQI